MSAGIAHEINNPLAIIQGTVRSLRKFVADPEQLGVRLERIEHSVGRIAKIVGGLRKFSRSSEKSEYSAHDLGDIVREAVVLTGAKARRHATAVDLDLITRAPIFCDEIEIEQVLVNLINNGIDAAKKSEPRWVKITLFADATHVVLQVRDSGRGISPEMHGKLFQPFATTKQVGEGTGLGLSIVKGIIDEHRGKIEVLSHEQHTCFEIKLPKVGEKNDAA
jgi:C4-dicarboxylate-specific signal transduction histidine kinase